MLFKCPKIPNFNYENKDVLDIGCGRKKIPGSIGLDVMELPGVDIVSDLNKPLPFKKEQFDIVYCNQVLEHIDDIVFLVYEILRVLKPGGIFIAHVPYFRSVWAWTDPTHVRCFTISTMDYFLKGSWVYNNYRFKDEGFSHLDVFLDYEYNYNLLRRFFIKRALRDRWKFENSFLSGLYRFEEISYIFTK